MHSVIRSNLPRLPSAKIRSYPTPHGGKLGRDTGFCKKLGRCVLEVLCGFRGDSGIGNLIRPLRPPPSSELLDLNNLLASSTRVSGGELRLRRKPSVWVDCKFFVSLGRIPGRHYPPHQMRLGTRGQIRSFPIWSTATWYFRAIGGNNYDVSPPPSSSGRNFAIRTLYVYAYDLRTHPLLFRPPLHYGIHAQCNPTWIMYGARHWQRTQRDAENREGRSAAQRKLRHAQ